MGWPRYFRAKTMQETHKFSKFHEKEWLFCLSVMFEHMSIAQVRVNVCMKFFCVKEMLRERLWSPRNADVSISNFQKVK
jgi:hypothetical protein